MPDDPLKRWARAARRPVLLRGTLTWAQVRIPNPELLLRRGVLDASLRSLVLKFRSAGLDLDELDDDALRAFLRMTDAMVAYSVRAIGPHGRDHAADTHQDADGETVDGPPPETFVDVALKPEDLEEYEFDELDLEDLKAMALRKVTPHLVTAMARRDAGLLTEQQFKAVEDEEAPETTTGWAGFRDELGGGERGAPGAEVRQPAELPAGDPGQVRSLSGG